MDFNVLKKIFLFQLKDLYSAEKQLSQFLPKLIRASVNKELKMVLREHLEQTKVHASRIEGIVVSHSMNPEGENCNSMEGLIEELEEMMEESDTTDVIDVHLISGLQKIEHYEIACYSSLITLGHGLGDEKAAELLQLSLDEEYEMDNKLDKIAEEIIQIYSKVGLT